jgi:hypothetical protein
MITTGAIKTIKSSKILINSNIMIQVYLLKFCKRHKIIKSIVLNITVLIVYDFNKSVKNVLKFILLKPKLSSITNIRYIENGILKNSQASVIILTNNIPVIRGCKCNDMRLVFK